MIVSLHLYGKGSNGVQPACVFYIITSSREGEIRATETVTALLKEAQDSFYNISIFFLVFFYNISILSHFKNARVFERGATVLYIPTHTPQSSM